MIGGKKNCVDGVDHGNFSSSEVGYHGDVKACGASDQRVFGNMLVHVQKQNIVRDSNTNSYYYNELAGQLSSPHVRNPLDYVVQFFLLLQVSLLSHPPPLR